MRHKLNDHLTEIDPRCTNRIDNQRPWKENTVERYIIYQNKSRRRGAKQLSTREPVQAPRSPESPSGLTRQQLRRSGNAVRYRRAFVLLYWMEGLDGSREQRAMWGDLGKRPKMRLRGCSKARWATDRPLSDRTYLIFNACRKYT